MLTDFGDIMKYVVIPFSSREEQQIDLYLFSVE